MEQPTKNVVAPQLRCDLAAGWHGSVGDTLAHTRTPTHTHSATQLTQLAYSVRLCISQFVGVGGAENLGGQRLSTPVSVAGFLFPVPTSGMLPLAFSAQRDAENT